MARCRSRVWAWFSASARVSLSSTPPLARAPGDNGRSSRESKLLKVCCAVARARAPCFTWSKVESSRRLVLSSAHRRHCLPVWKQHVVRRLRAKFWTSLCGILRFGAAESCRAGFKDRSGHAHNATPVRGSLDYGGSPVRSRGPVLQWPLQLARKVRTWSKLVPTRGSI